MSGPLGGIFLTHTVFRPVKYGGITSYITLCVGFFQNNDNQVNFGDPIGDIMISEYHTILHTYDTCIWRKFCPDACPRLHVVLQVIFARKWLRMQICPVKVAKISLG